jgi:MYXO-CTERM domain-containing protein
MKTCVNGACVTTCDCLPCGSGLACQSSSGKCVQSGCENTVCDTGLVCQAAICVPTCTGAVCPGGQICSTGKCIDDTGSGQDMGTDDSGSDTVGGSVALSGCTCHLAPDHRASNAMGIGGGLLLLGLAWRRSRRRARA